MSAIPNSVAARDIAYLVHPQTDLKGHLEKGPIVVGRGDGVHVYGEDGEPFIDASSGLWCASLGFNVERLARVAYEQMRALSYYHIYRSRTHEPAVDLAEKLLSIAPESMSKVLFQCSGSEANDVAIKLVWYYHAAIGKPGKRKIIGRRMGYHGSTVASVSLSGKPDMHADFGLPIDGFLHADTPYYYRDAAPGESEEDYATRLADALDAMIVAEGPETVGAFFAEPVLGGGGALIPPRTYFEKVQAVLSRHEVLFIADEVICGFGRTGSMWGTETFDLQPDMMTCAKALSAGALPISAVLIGERVFDAMLTESEKLGSFAHGFTYAGHPVSSAVALETLKIYEEMDLIARVADLNAMLRRAFEPVAAHPMVGDLGIIGAMVGVELVRDKAARVRFEADEGIGARVAQASLRNGLIHRGMGNRAAFAPSYVSTEAEIADVGERFMRSLDDVWNEVGG